GRLEVFQNIGVQGANNAHIVGHVAQLREQFADYQAGFTPRRELERRADQVERLIGGIAQVSAEDFLAVVLLEFWLGIKRIDVGKAAGEEDHDQVLGLGREVGTLRGVDFAALELSRERQGRIEAESAGGTTPQKITTTQQRAGLHVKRLLDC